MDLYIVGTSSTVRQCCVGAIAVPRYNGLRATAIRARVLGSFKMAPQSKKQREPWLHIVRSPLPSAFNMPYLQCEKLDRYTESNWPSPNLANPRKYPRRSLEIASVACTQLRTPSGRQLNQFQFINTDDHFVNWLGFRREDGDDVESCHHLAVVRVHTYPDVITDQRILGIHWRISRCGIAEHMYSERELRDTRHPAAENTQDLNSRVHCVTIRKKRPRLGGPIYHMRVQNSRSRGWPFP